MVQKLARLPLRTSKISEEEKRAAKDAIKAFDQFLKQLWAARQQDKRLINVLEQNKDTDPSSLFEIRHLLRRFQKEVKDRYTKLIIMFAGKKNSDLDTVSWGIMHLLKPLEHDTITRQIKNALQDAMQQLTEITEEFLEAFENFGDKEQINKIISMSGKVDTMVSSIENVIENQLRTHFERNILKPKKLSAIRRGICKRARLIKMLGGL